jgi:hypothetical protein
MICTGGLLMFWKRILMVVVSLLLMTPVAAQSPQPFEDRTDPVLLLASYYNAVNQRDYPRAYGYWESPPRNMSLAQFTQGYSDTAGVIGLVRLPVQIGAAAGSVYAALPTTLIASRFNGSQQTYMGCYVARRSNVPLGDQTTPDPNWSLYQASVRTTASPITPILLDQSCLGTPYDDSQLPRLDFYDSRLTPIELLTSYYNAINRREYERAYAYWEVAPNNDSLAQFTQGFASTASVTAFAGLDIHAEGAAGSVYMSMPTLLAAMQTDGSQRLFAGCLVARRSNVGAPQDSIWNLYSASIVPVANMSLGIARLAQGCAL